MWEVIGWVYGRDGRGEDCVYFVWREGDGEGVDAWGKGVVFVKGALVVDVVYACGWMSGGLDFLRMLGRHGFDGGRARFGGGRVRGA